MASSSKQHFQTFTVGKLDAGMILIGDRAHLIEFPSLLLPPGTAAGSIVSISVHRNLAAEQAHAQSFASLQRSILQAYGTHSPQPPVLTLRNTTQTSVTLEWGKLELANAKLRGLEIYRNGTRLAGIPNPGHNTSTKLSSLALDTDYTFQLVMKTTAGTFPSNVVRVRTHTINDTSGISVCFGTVQDPNHLHQAKIALDEMGAKYSDKIQIDTTHFVCTTPAGAQPGSGPSVEYQKALQLTLPVVEPGWVMACLHEKKMVPISQHMLGSNSSAAFNPVPSPAFNRPSSPSLPPSPHTTTEDQQHVFPQQHLPDGEDSISPETRARQEEEEANERERNRPRTPGGGVLNRGFKFPLSSEAGGPPTPPPGSEAFPPTPPAPQRAASPPPPPSAVTEPEPEVQPAPPIPEIVIHEHHRDESMVSPIPIAVSPPTPPPTEPTIAEEELTVEPDHSEPAPDPEIDPTPEVVESALEVEVEEDASSSAPVAPEIVVEDAETSLGATEEVVVMAPADASEDEPEEEGKVGGEEVMDEVTAAFEDVEIKEPEPAAAPEQVTESEEVKLEPVSLEKEEPEAEAEVEAVEEGEGEDEEEGETEGEGEKTPEEPTKVAAGGGGGGNGGGKKKKNGKKGKGKK